MTSPDSVGSVSVEVIGEASNLAKKIRAEVEEGVKGLNLREQVEKSIGDRPIDVPVKPEVDDTELGKKPVKVPVKPDFDGDPVAPLKKPVKVPLEPDPVFDAFRSQLRSQVSALAKQVHAVVPVEGDTEGLRGELAGQLASVAKQLKAKIPVEPEDKAKLQAELQAQVADVAAKVKAKVPVEPDTKEIPEKIKETVKETPIPPVKVPVDPLLSDFQSQVRSEVSGLARAVNAHIPVGADTSRLRQEIAADLAAIDRELKAEIPTEPGARGEYEARLKALVDEASARVKATIKVDAKPETLNLSSLSGIAGKLTPNLLGGGAVSAVGALFQNLGDAVAKFTADAAEGGSQLAGAVSAAAGPVGSIVGLLASAQAAVLALGGAATVLVPAFTAAAGAAAAIPAGLAGLGAAFGTLSLGFKGISEAFKPKTGGGGGGGGAGTSAAQQARQVAAASRQVESARRGIAAANRSLEASERSLAAAQRGVATAQRALVDAEQAVADAQKKATLAQKAVNQARQEAAQDIIDMNLQLKDSKLSEQEAALAVTDALRALNEVKLTGNIPDIQKADLAYQRAQLTLEETTQQTKELQTSTDTANKKGVEGSDKVQSALSDQQDALQSVKKAQEGVTDAQNGVLDAADSLKSAQDGVLSAKDGVKSAMDSLASAQDSLAQASQKSAAASAGAAAAAQKMIPLAPAAQRFVNALKALKPAFEALRLDVQQRLFQGLDQTVTHLGNAWIPALRTTLGAYADTFNAFFKNLGAAISTPKFIADLQAGAEGARQGMAAIGSSITTSLVPAFGALSRAAGPFLTQLGREIAGIVTEFSNWVLQGEKSGGLTTFFARASTALHEIFTTGKLVGKIIGDLFSIIVGAQQTSGKTPLDALNDGLAKVDKWLSDPKHQQQLRTFVTDLADGFKTFGQTVSTISGWLQSLTGGTDAGGAGAAIGRALVAGLIAGIGEAMKASIAVGLSFFGPPGPLISGIKDLLGIHSPSTVMAHIGHDLVAGLLQGIGDMLGSLASAAVAIANTVITMLAGSASWLVGIGRNAVIGLINGVGSLLGTLGSYAGNLRATVINATASAGSWLVTAGRNAVVGLGNGILGYYSKAASWAGQLRTAVTGALSNAGSLLVAAGKNIVIGLINGIASMVGSLGSYLGSVTSFIQAHKGPPSKDKVLLFGAGQLIMGGLISGIAAQKDALAAQLADVTGLVAGTTLPALGAGAMDAALAASLQASSTQQVQVQWKTGTTGDQLLDAFARVIDLRYGGDVTRALTRA